MPPPGKLLPRLRPEAVLGAELRAQQQEARALGFPGIPSCCQAQQHPPPGRGMLGTVVSVCSSASPGSGESHWLHCWAVPSGTEALGRRVGVTPSHQAHPAGRASRPWNRPGHVTAAPRARSVSQRRCRPASPGSRPAPALALLPPRARRRHGTCSPPPAPAPFPSRAPPPPPPAPRLAAAAAAAGVAAAGAARSHGREPWPGEPPHQEL